MADLNDMMVFSKVVELGSFTLAAEAIGLPKSNVSRKVTRLENALGVRLLERSTRSLHLTEIGEVYLQHCLRIKEELEDAHQSIESLTDDITGTIKIGASIGVGQHLLTPILAEFKASFSQVKLALDFTNRRVDIIEEGFDIVIRVGESPDSNMISKKLNSVAMHLYASKHYLAAINSFDNDIKCIEDLAQHPCLHMDAVEPRARWQLFDGEREQYVNIQPDITANDFYTLASLAEHGLGIALLPDYLAEGNGTLAKVLPHCVGRHVNLYAIYPSRKGVTPKLRVFIDFLTSKM